MKSKNEKVRDPVMQAVLAGEIGELKQLVEAGTSCDAQDEDGRTPLMMAATSGIATALAVLVQAGANVNLKDASGYTALHFAAQSNAAEATELLLSANADVDSCDNYGNSPLWRAVFNSRGKGEVITLLLGAGASRDLKNKSGVSPRDLAFSIANYDVLKFVR